MEIQRVYNGLLPDSGKRQAVEDDSPPVQQDSVTISGRAEIAAVSRESIVDQIFNARKTLWTNSWNKDTTTKGIIMAPDGDIITATYCNLKKVSGKDGKTVWEKDVYEKNHNLSTSPAVIAKDGSLLIGTTDGVLQSLNPSTGKEIWRYKTGAYSTEPVQADDGTIYVQKGKDIAAVNADGTEKFHASIGRNRARIGFVDSKGGAYVICDSDLFAIGSEGKKRWQARGRDASGFPDYPDRVFITANEDIPDPVQKNITTSLSVISARDSETGDKLWENEYDYARIDGYYKGLVIVYEHDKVSAVDAGTGESRWEYPGRQQKHIKTVTSDGTLILHDCRHYEALDVTTGKPKWILDIKGYNGSAPAIETRDGNVIIADSKTVYCVDREKGDVKFKFKMDKGIGRFALSRDETVVYAEEPGTGAINAIDFRNAAEMAKDFLKSPAATETPDQSHIGEVSVGTEYIIIDGIALPVKKQQQS